MTPNQVHLALLHFPVVLPVVGLGLLAAGVLLRSSALWRSALATFVAAALFAWPVFLTGEEAEERIERSPGVSEELVEEHEEAAKVAQVAIQVLGAAAVLAFFLTWKPGTPRLWHAGAIGVLALAASISVGYAAHEGGKIRHPEVRGDGGATPRQSID